jgi:flagellar biosynthesis protein FliP
MKRVTPSLLVATLRTAFTVGIALILIFVLLPAVLAAQATGPR